MAEQNLVVHNRGNVPTFVRRNSESFIDITFSTRKIADQITNWKVIEEENLSYHQHITFEIGVKRETKVMSTTRRKGWKITKDGTAAVAKEVGRLMKTLDMEDTTTKDLTRLVQSACDRTLPIKRAGRHGQPVYWWSDEISNIRK